MLRVMQAIQIMRYVCKKRTKIQEDNDLFQEMVGIKKIINAPYSLWIFSNKIYYQDLKPRYKMVYRWSWKEKGSGQKGDYI